MTGALLPAGTESPAPAPAGDGFAVLARKARAFADARTRLAEVVDEAAEERKAAVRKRERSIRARWNAMEKARRELHAEVERRKALFQVENKPKTRVSSGIRYGLKKDQDTLSGNVDDAVVRIEAARWMSRERKEGLLRKRTTLVAAAVRELKESELAMIGLELEVGKDQVVVKPIDDLESALKLVKGDLA